MFILFAGLGACTTVPDDGGGLTTEELARILLSYDLDWALNLDGGRSAYLRFPNGRTRSRGIWFRRCGPVLLRFLPAEEQPRVQEVVQ